MTKKTRHAAILAILAAIGAVGAVGCRNFTLISVTIVKPENADLEHEKPDLALKVVRKNTQTNDNQTGE